MLRFRIAHFHAATICGTRLRSQFDRLTKELADSRQRSDSIIMQLSKTIEKQQSQIRHQTRLSEDLRQPKPFWQRLFQRERKLQGSPI